MARRLDISSLFPFVAGGLILTYLFKDKINFSAEEEPSLFSKLVSRVRANNEPETPTVEESNLDVVGEFRPADLERVDVERTGVTVDVIPIVAGNRRTPAQRGSDFLVKSMKTPVVNDGPFGPGVSDVRVAKVNPYDYNLSAEDFLSFSATALGQEIPNSKVKQLNTHLPNCCYPSDYPELSDKKLKLDEVDGAINRKGDLARLSNKNRTSQDTLPPDLNDAYTDGTYTMPISQWMSSHQIERISDTQVRAIAISGGQDALLRRV